MTTFTYQAWVGIVAILVGAGVTAFGWAIRRKSWKGWLAFAAGAFTTIGFAPCAYVDKVVIDNKHFESRWGIWMMPTLHNIEFDDVKLVTLTSKTTTSRRRKRTNYYLNFQLKSGGTAEVATGNTLMDAASNKLIERFAAYQIAVIDNTGGK